MRIAGAAVTFGTHQHQGARAKQEDFVAVHVEDGPEQNAALLVLADGVGGQAGGAMASVLAVNAFLRYFRGRTARDGASVTLSACVHAANRAVTAVREPGGGELATTLVAAWADAEGFRFASVGDSAVLLCRAGGAARLNREHNVGAKVDGECAAGVVSPQQAREHDGFRSQLTSYLGMPQPTAVDISAPQPLVPGDTLVLASDGLTGTLDLREIGALASSGADADAACRALVAAALAKGRPTQDNVSVVALRVDGGGPPLVLPAPPPADKPRSWLGFLTGLTVGVVALVAVLLARDDTPPAPPPPSAACAPCPPVASPPPALPPTDVRMPPPADGVPTATPDGASQARDVHSAAPDTERRRPPRKARR